MGFKDFFSWFLFGAKQMSLETCHRNTAGRSGGFKVFQLYKYEHVHDHLLFGPNLFYFILI